MPIVTFHLVEGESSAEQDELLLVRASQLYANILSAPMERVRAFISSYAPRRCVIAGIPASRGAASAPYFEFLVLEGRPPEQRDRLLAGFTDLLVDVLGVRRDLVRGRCLELSPDDWAIGGVPARAVRADEVAARAAHAQQLAQQQAGNGCAGRAGPCPSCHRQNGGNAA